MMSPTGRLLLLFALVLVLSSPAEAQSPSLKDLQFTAVQPCRIYDTRPGSGVQGEGTGPIAAGQNRDVDVTHGTAPSCGIPTQARAVVMNFIAVGPAGAGHLQAWPFGTALPTASIINYANVAGLNIANGLVQPICGFCTHGLTLRANVSATHVVIDVLGYFAPPGAAPLWGRGRPNTKMWGLGGDFFCANGAIAFGLSDIFVTWGSAADACPQGTWVCTAAERGTASCNTSRPDTSCDALLCNGACSNPDPNNHAGWVADQYNMTNGYAISEFGLIEIFPPCFALPVWCCTE